MANLSNINGKFVVEQTTGYVGIGITDPAFPLEVKSASAELALNATAGSIYRVRSTASDEFIITKNGVGDRLTISGGGDATFAGNITFGDSHFIGDDGDDNLLIQSSAGENLMIDSADRIYLDSSTDGDVRFLDDGTQYGQIFVVASNMYMRPNAVDADFYIQGNDGGSYINMLYFNTSHNGNATFSGEITSGDDINTPTKIVIGESGSAELRLKKTDAGYAKVSFYNNPGTSAQVAYISVDSAEDFTYYGASGVDQVFYAGGVLNLTLSGTTATFAGMITVNGGGIDIDNNDDVRLRFDNAGTFKAGLQVATTAGDMIAGSAVNDFAIRTQENMLFATGGNTERMRITNDGQFLMSRTGQPPITNSLYGTMVLQTNADTNFLRIRFDVDTTPYWGLTKLNTGNFAITGRIGSNWDDHVFEIEQTNGNIGIGTATPDEKLSVYNGNISINNSHSFMVGGATGDTIIGRLGNTSGVLNLQAESTRSIRLGNVSQGELVRIDAYNQRVGIGTTSPDKRLTVGGVNPTEGINLKTKSGSNVWTIWSVEQYFSQEGYMRLFYDNVSKIQFRADGDSFFNGGDVGIGTTAPGAKLDLVGELFVGDSTTGTSIYRKHQSFATMKPGPSSGGSIDMMFVDHTHALDITVMAYVSTSNVATGRGYSVAAYGSTSTGLTQTAFAGVISALSISYVNTGGTENYVLRVTTTYSGATAPVLSVTATGQSSSKLRAAT